MLIGYRLILTLRVVCVFDLRLCEQHTQISAPAFRQTRLSKTVQSTGQVVSTAAAL